jgi:molybdopterin converting factor subunit 1
MRITVKFFAILKDHAGLSETSIDLPTDSIVSTALNHLENKFPALRKDLKRIAIAVNRNYTKSDALLHDGDELALIPPVSGG